MSELLVCLFVFLAVSFLLGIAGKRRKSSISLVIEDSPSRFYRTSVVTEEGPRVFRSVEIFRPTHLVSAETRPFGKLSSEAPRLTITTSSAKVVVSRASGSNQIEFRSNFPSLFHSEGNSISQSNEPSTALLRSQDARSLDLSGFDINKLPEDPEQVKIHSATEATIGATRAELTFEVAQLEVILPATYTGGLTVISTDSGDVEIANDWFGGDFKAQLLKSGTLTAQSFRNVDTVDLSTFRPFDRR